MPASDPTSKPKRNSPNREKMKRDRDEVYNNLTRVVKELTETLATIDD